MQLGNKIHAVTTPQSSQPIWAQNEEDRTLGRVLAAAGLQRRIYSVAELDQKLGERKNLTPAERIEAKRALERAGLLRN